MPPSETGFEWNLYRAPVDDAAEAQVLEQHFFRVVDDQAAKILFKWNAPTVPKLSARELSHWSVFILSLLHRTPENLAASKAGGSKIWHNNAEHVRERYEDLRGPNDPLTYQEYVAGQDEREPERSLLRILPRIVLNETLGRILNGLYWQVYQLTDQVPDLLLSDDPVARTGGLKRHNGHMAMPLSPRRLLVGTWDAAFHHELRRMPAKDLAKGMNAWCVEGARHFVAAKDRSQARFIENRFGSNLRSGIGRAVS